MYNYIFTCNPKNSELTIYEFRKKDDSYHFITWLDEGVMCHMLGYLRQS